MVLSTLGTIGPLAYRGFQWVNDKTGGKFGKYVGGKLVEWGAHVTRRMLDRANSDKANKVAKKVAEEAVEAAEEITGKDSYITKKVTKAANIITPDKDVQTITVQPITALSSVAASSASMTPLIDNVPYSKRLYGTNFQRYSPRVLKKVKLEHEVVGRPLKRHRRKARVLRDVNE